VRLQKANGDKDFDITTEDIKVGDTRCGEFYLQTLWLPPSPP